MAFWITALAFQSTPRTKRLLDVTEENFHARRRASMFRFFSIKQRSINGRLAFCSCAESSLQLLEEFRHDTILINV